MFYARSAQTMFVNMLGTLDHLVETAQTAGMADDVLAQRLTDGMCPLELQFRVALNQVLLALNQVGGANVPLEEVPYRLLLEVRERIAVVRAQIDRADPGGWTNAAATVDLTLIGTPPKMSFLNNFKRLRQISAGSRFGADPHPETNTPDLSKPQTNCPPGSR